MKGKVTKMTDYRLKQRKILEQLCVWRRLSVEEQMRFNTAATEIQVDNLMTTYRRKYM